MLETRGKTALAVHWAHRNRAGFPDGQLYANLHGYSDTPPVSPVGVLARFLRALGFAADHIPADAEEAAAVYRTVLADRRVLVVLDNAHDADQLRLLLPGSASCFVLITSRDRLTGTIARDGGRPIALCGLPVPEARALLTRILGAERGRREAPELTRLATACAGLPLALRITAANLAGRAPHRIGDYLTELERDRLGALRVGGDHQSAVRAAFDLSYQRLTTEQRGLFRMLGLMPGPDFTVDAAAALVGHPSSRMRRMLAELEDAHLVERPGPERIAIHDLLRLYAREAAHTQDGAARRAAAYGRLVAWQLRRVDDAARLLYPQVLRLRAVPQGDQPYPGQFSDHQAALAWLEAERANLVATVVNATDYDQHRSAGLLADALRGYFRLRRQTSDWLTVAEHVVATATTRGDHRERAAALLSLATARHVQGDHDRAVECFAEGLAASRAAGWRDAEAAILGNLAGVLRELGQLPAAADHLSRALRIYQQTERRPGRAIHLANLGLVLWELGRLAEATRCLTESLALHEQLGSSSGQASTLDVLGGTAHAQGRIAEAFTHLNRAVTLHRAVGDVEGQARALSALAEVYCDVGRVPSALECVSSAVPLAREAGDICLEATAASVRAAVLVRLGQRQRALDAYTEALRLARDGGSRYVEARVSIGLAACWLEIGHLGRAGRGARRSAALAGEGGLRILEGQARMLLADIARRAHEHDTAIQQATSAVDIQRETGHRPGEARALLILSDAMEQAGDRDGAAQPRAAGLAMLAEIGLAPPR